MIRAYQPSPPVHWTWISQVGPDAEDFLHRLTTIDVRRITPGTGARGCFLNAHGKIRAYFDLWRYGPEEYAFEFDAGATGEWKIELLKVVDQFTFAERFQIAPVEGLDCRWILASPGEGAPGALRVLAPLATQALDGEIRACHHGNRDFGRPWISVWGTPERLGAWMSRHFPGVEPVDFGALEDWRIRALRPRIDAEITDATIPLEVGLNDALATNKGCYPGQEVIERIISLGSPARRLARIDGSGPIPRPGDKILNLAEPPAEVGEVTSVTGDERGFAALGLVRKIHAKDGLEVRFREGSRARVIQVAPYA